MKTFSLITGFWAKTTLNKEITVRNTGREYTTIIIKRNSLTDKCVEPKPKGPLPST